MALRIGFDIDGVFADMDGALAREAEAVFGEAMPQGTAGAEEAGKTGEAGRAGETGEIDPESSAEIPQIRLQLTSRQRRRLWHHVASIDNFWETLREIETGSIARLARCAAERRWDIIFLTKRPSSAGATAQVQTQRWLQSKGFLLPSVFVVQGSRGRIAASLALDFVIDDTPENCLDVVVDSRARAVLVWRDDERHLPGAARRLGIGVVKSVGECLDILAQVNASSAERPGMIDRVMRLLGLKEEGAESR
jgi:hypothetical protein